MKYEENEGTAKLVNYYVSILNDRKIEIKKKILKNPKKS
jgi:hypothetical protein